MRSDFAQATFAERAHNPILSEYAIYHQLNNLSPFRIGLHLLYFRFRSSHQDDTVG
jgi:hypothetical protein